VRHNSIQAEQLLEIYRPDWQQSRLALANPLEPISSAVDPRKVPVAPPLSD
jgi:hypothetical protein